MSSLIAALIFGAGAFFMCCTIFLIVMDSVKFQNSMAAVKKLAQTVKGNHETRRKEVEEFLVRAVGYQEETSETKQAADEIIEKEIAFYKSTIKVLQDKSFSSIENYSVYVESLLSPYYKLTNHSSGSNMPAAGMIPGQAPVTNATAATADAPATAAPAATADAPAATADAPVATADAPVATADAPATTADAPAATADAPAATADAPAADSGAGINPQDMPAMEEKLTAAESKVETLEGEKSKFSEIMVKVFKAYMGLFGKVSFGADDLMPDVIARTVDEMIANDAKPIVAPADGNVSAKAALLEQLKFEKVELLNKYESAMKTLNLVYKEYAAAFGMDKGGDNDLSLEQIRSLMGEDLDGGESDNSDGDAGLEGADEAQAG